MRVLLACIFKSQQVSKPPVLIQRGTHVFTANTSIFSKRKAFSARLACRLLYYLTTSLLTQYDSFSEKLTFFQNSLLLLYIAKKRENWKTVTLFFLVIFWQSLFFLQPGRKNQSSSFQSCIWCWSSFFSITLGSMLIFFIFWCLRFYIYKRIN